MEFLAPAGSMEALRAAVCNGADAVYLGADTFNARMNARNFSEVRVGADDAVRPQKAVVFPEVCGESVCTCLYDCRGRGPHRPVGQLRICRRSP